jgi:Fe-S-cluster containining protein
MPEILGDYDSVEFSEHQKDFVNHAKNNYIAQLNTNDPIKEKVLAMYDVIDEINKDSFAPPKDQPSCKKGCSHCCFIQVATMEWEIITILEYMKHQGLEFEPEELELLEKQALIKDDKEYIVSPHRRCVFLGKDNLCGIYPVRPSACRNYYVFSDPSECDTFNPNASGRTLVNFNLDTIAPILALMELSEMKPMAKHLLQKLKEQA